MQYNTGSHCVFFRRYHLVWSTKDRFKVLKGRVRLPVRDICRQVCHENEECGGHNLPRNGLSGFDRSMLRAPKCPGFAA